jgi:hypothetical protein
MDKDAYYFSHDSNATGDIKIISMMDDMGPEGYGIYWILVEHLRDQTGYQSSMKILKSLAKRNMPIDGNVDEYAEKFSSVVSNYDLFVIEDDIFYSESLIRRMEIYEETKAKRREAGRKGGKTKSGKHRDDIASQSDYSKESSIDIEIHEPEITSNKDDKNQAMLKQCLSKNKATLKHTSSSKVKESKLIKLEEKEKEVGDFPSPPENVTKNHTVEEPEDDMPSGDILTESIAEWNSRSPPLPRYRYLSPNLGAAEGVGRTITAYSKPEIFKAIENYTEIIGDRVQYKPNPEYTGLPGFLAKGVEKYADDAYPFDRCRFRSFQDADAEAEKKRQERIMANLGIGGIDDG